MDGWMDGSGGKESKLIQLFCAEESTLDSWLPYSCGFRHLTIFLSFGLAGTTIIIPPWSAMEFGLFKLVHKKDLSLLIGVSILIL